MYYIYSKPYAIINTEKGAWRKRSSINKGEYEQWE